MTETQTSQKAMNDAATSSRAATAQTKPKRAKKPALTPEQKIEALQKKQAQLDAQIKDQKAKIKSKERKADTRRKIVAGAIALEHMEHDENFKGIMEGLLKRHIKESDQALFDL